MAFSSKEIIIILIGLVSTAFLGIILNTIDLNQYTSQIKNSITMVVIVFIAAITIISILYKKMSEVNKELELINSKQKDLEEKLKRTEDLINIRVDIKELQKEIFKNGKK